MGAFRPLPFGLYGVVLFQSALTATLLALLGRSVFPGEKGATRVPILGGLAIAVSPTAFHISTLMPDVSTLWIGLALPIIVLSPAPAIAWLAGGVAAVATTFHTSNTLILVGAVPAARIAARFTGKRMARSAWILGCALAFQALAFGWNASRAVGWASLRGQRGPSSFSRLGCMRGGFSRGLFGRSAPKRRLAFRGRSPRTGPAVSPRRPEAFRVFSGTPDRR